MVIIKDLLAIASEKSDTEGLDLLKSYHFKTAMANMLEKRQQTKSNEELNITSLFKETVQ